MSSNPEYKSDVFSMLMEIPENSLSLYNTLNHSDYRDPSQVQIYKLENGIHLSIRNDASFIIDSYLSLYEHQSRYNPNMPLRFLIYVTDLFKQLVKNKDLMSSSLKKVPTPRFAVFYNGSEERAEIEHMNLSDAFEQPTDMPELELKCTVYNINPTYNRELLEKCSVLNEYTAFVERVRRCLETKPLDTALDLAIDSCIADNILREFLRLHRAEVKRVSMLDYTFERRLELAEQESQEEIERLTGKVDELKAEKNQLAVENELLEANEKQLAAEKEQLTVENEQLTAENEQLTAELKRVRKLLAEHKIEAE